MIIKGDISAVGVVTSTAKWRASSSCSIAGPSVRAGKVKALCRARDVVIWNVQGNVEVSEKITIQRNGSLDRRHSRTAGIVIDDGAISRAASTS